MKKILLILLCVFSLDAFSQEETRPNNNTYEKTASDLHEISINAPTLLLGNFQITYESLFSERFTFGGTLSIPFDDYVSWRLNHAITGFSRYYFGDEYASGLFIEGFVTYNNFEYRFDQVENFQTVRRSKNEPNVAVGFSFGKKIYYNGGFTIDIFAGIAHNLINIDDKYDKKFAFIPRGGVYFGYRF